MDQDMFEVKRSEMVQTQLRDRGISNEKVLEVMRATPRHLFVPENEVIHAYEDRPLNIGYGQTISQPYIVAFMTEAANLKDNGQVLEIGTGSGYQAAILARLCKEVYTMEVVEPLGKASETRLHQLGYRNIQVRIGDGYNGWPEQAPFDVIMVTAAPETVPEKLIEQLKEGGRLIIPVGAASQELMRLTKTKEGVEKENLLPVRFVPLVKSSH